ncbi:Protein kinase-like domain [Trichoderma simmonsii]|uniref:Protein kinase-like domain n=1 Tax=Trichoderma simmonsii TaxID=1491479 RepID=A0A8G0PK34_9HYPO|nr:Protein kinase-like domain [Trichoderma simmonsii]
MENNLTSPSRYCIAELSTNVLSDFKIILASLQGELKLNDNVFRGVDGFLAKYFKKSDTVQDTIDDAKSADGVDQLSTNIFNIAHLDTLMDWLVDFRSLFFPADPNIPFRFRFSFRCESITTPGPPFSASIYFETEDISTTTGSTRVYGEYHHGDAPDNGFLPFAARALQVFKAQPTRHFLHAFILHGTTLELWVFDRVGAYSSGPIDLAQNPQELFHIMAGYGMMNDKEYGINTFVKCLGPGSDSYISFDEGVPSDTASSSDGDVASDEGTIKKLYLRQEMLAAPGYLVGLGTTCFAASESTTDKPNIVVKFSWRADNTIDEPQLLWKLRERGTSGVVEILGHKDLVSIADLRQDLQFPGPFVNRTLSCIVTSPLGRPIRKFSSISELLGVLGDLAMTIKSLFLNVKMLHRDIAIKNLVIDPQEQRRIRNSIIYQGSYSVDPQGILIDFGAALDLEKGPPPRQIVGSDGFMAIGVLRGEPHTYRHDLESLFYVFLWLAIANDSEHDHAHEILERLPKTSRLQKWRSPDLDFEAVWKAVEADMSPEGFEEILGEFSPDFDPFKDLARKLRGLIFPVQDGVIFTGTDTDEEAAARLCDEMADAFLKEYRRKWYLY